MSLSKKIFIISSSFLVILLLLWGLYTFSFKKNPLPTINNSEEVPILPKEQKSDSKITPVSNDSVLSPVLLGEESVIKYYSKQNGKVYQVEFDGSGNTTMANKELPGILNVSWSPNKDKVITSFSSNGKTDFFYYDYNTNSSKKLKDNLDTVVWQNNDKILYKYYNSANKERTLNIANPDGSDWKTITTLDFRYLGVAPVPMTGLVSFWNQGDAFEETLFQTIPIIGGEKKVIFSGKFGADYLWSPNGNTLLISNVLTRGGSSLQLGLANGSGGEYRDLGAPTLVSKCVWSKDNKTVYYALPAVIPEGSIMPNDYNSKKVMTSDTFWKIDVTTGKKDRLIELNEDKTAGDFDATNLFLNEDESMLFFVNRKDDKLYRIDL